MERLKVTQVPETNGMQYCVLAADNALVGHLTPTLIVGSESVVVLSKDTVYTWSAIGEFETCGSGKQQIEQIVRYYLQLDSECTILARGITDLHATPTSLTLGVGHSSVMQLYTHRVAGLPAFEREGNIVYLNYADETLQHVVVKNPALNKDMLHYSILTKVDCLSTYKTTQPQVN